VRPRSSRWCTTLLEAILLVVLVVILFLQTWRASIIPLLAVPVSVVGHFRRAAPAGFSINTLSLFGLVLWRSHRGRRRDRRWWRTSSATSRPA
jgi:multidrug efflux pump subunit AcrB